MLETLYKGAEAPIHRPCVFVEPPHKDARVENPGKLLPSAPPLLTHFWSFFVLPGAHQHLVLQGVFVPPVFQQENRPPTAAPRDHCGNSRTAYHSRGNSSSATPFLRRSLVKTRFDEGKRLLAFHIRPLQV